MSRAAALTLAFLLAFAGRVVADSAPPIAFSDTTPSVDAESDALWVDAVGRPDPRIERWDARRNAARRVAEERGRALLHAHVDAKLASVRAHPEQASAVHRVIDEQARRVGVRPLVDGGAVVRVEVPLAELRAAAGDAEVEF